MPPKETSLLIPSLRRPNIPGTSVQVVGNKEPVEQRFLAPETFPPGTVRCSSSHPLRGGCLTAACPLAAYRRRIGTPYRHSLFNPAQPEAQLPSNNRVSPRKRR